MWFYLKCCFICQCQFETSFLSSFSQLLFIEPQYKLYKAVPFKCHVDLVIRVLLHFCMYSLHMGLKNNVFLVNKNQINNISFSLFWLLIVMMLMLKILANIHADVDSLPIVAPTDPHLFSVFFRASKDML